MFFVLKSKFLNQYKFVFPKKKKGSNKNSPKAQQTRADQNFSLQQICTQDPTGQTRVWTCGWCTTGNRCAFLGLLRAALRGKPWISLPVEGRFSKTTRSCQSRFFRGDPYKGGCLWPVGLSSFGHLEASSICIFVFFGGRGEFFKDSPPPKQ